MDTEGFLTLAERTPDRPALEIRCNFCMFAGREATPAELDNLAHALLQIVRDVAVVAEQRREVGPSTEAALHQVRIELTGDKLPKDDAETERLIVRLMQETERWATGCISDRSVGVAEA